MAKKTTRPPPPAQFDEWKRCLFARPAELCVIYDRTVPDFIDRDEALTFEAEPAATLALFVYTMRYMKWIAADCTPQQAAYGLNAIFNGSYGAISHDVMAAAATDPAARRDAILSIYDLYAGYLRDVSRSVIGRPAADIGELDHFTFMLWDVTPLAGWAGVYDETGDDWPLLTVLERVLRIPHDACIASALHGLGHMVFRTNRDRITAIVDRFLAATPGLGPELREYAEAARVGRVL